MAETVVGEWQLCEVDEDKGSCWSLLEPFVLFGSRAREFAVLLPPSEKINPRVAVSHGRRLSAIPIRHPNAPFVNRIASFDRRKVGHERTCGGHWVDI